MKTAFYVFLIGIVLGTVLMWVGYVYNPIGYVGLFITMASIIGMLNIIIVGVLRFIWC